MHEDPTRGLEELNQEVDRRRERRALTDSEIEKLFGTTQRSKRTICGLAGTDRALLYLLAIRTGLRRGELRSLTVDSFDFSSGSATVTVAARNSKRRRTDVLPLAPDFARLVADYLAMRDFDDAIWRGSWWRQASKMLRRDLDEAGIEAVASDGRIIDFHALRTTFVTSLARAGVLPAIAQINRSNTR